MGKKAESAPQTPSGPPSIDPEQVGWRTCAVTRQRHPKEYLLRFVSDPRRILTFDATGRLPGRGIYVYPERRNVQTLLARPGLLRRLTGNDSQAITLPDPATMNTQLETGLHRRLIQAIGLAKRCGALWPGLRGVQEQITPDNPQAFILLLAQDTARHTREKLQRLCNRFGPLETLEVLNRTTLGSACGRGPTAILTLARQGTGKQAHAAAWRWRALQPDSPSSTTGPSHTGPSPEQPRPPEIQGIRTALDTPAPGIH